MSARDSWVQLAAQRRAEGHTKADIARELRTRFGLRPLAALRHAHGWSQAQAAHEWNKLFTPLDDNKVKTAKDISDLETDRYTPSLDAYDKLARLYTCDLTDLLNDPPSYRHLDGAVHDDGEPEPDGPTLNAPLDGANRPDGASAPSATLPVPSLPLPSLTPDEDLEERLLHIVEQPRHVDRPAVEWLERCLAEHRRVEDEIGSAPLLAVIRTQLATVAALARHARPPIIDRMVSLAAQYAQFMGWLCNDSGDKATAFRWYERAHGWASEIGDVNMAASTFSQRAHLAWSINDGRRTVRLGQAARSHAGHVTPGVQGMAAQMTARGHALADEADAARAELDEAETLVSRAAERPEDEPPWLYFYDERWFTLQRGMVELQIGDGHRAVNLLTQGLDGLPGHYRRDRAWYRSCLARAHLIAGDVDAATEIAISTAPDAIALNQYALSELRDLAAAVTRRAEPQGRAISAGLTDAAVRDH